MVMCVSVCVSRPSAVTMTVWRRESSGENFIPEVIFRLSIYLYIYD